MNLVDIKKYLEPDEKILWAGRPTRYKLRRLAITFPPVFKFVMKKICIWALVAGITLALYGIFYGASKIFVESSVSNILGGISKTIAFLGGAAAMFGFIISPIKALYESLSATTYINSKELFLLSSKYAITTKGIICIYDRPLFFSHSSGTGRVDYSDLVGFKCIAAGDTGCIGLIKKNPTGTVLKPFSNKHEIDFIPYIDDYETVKRLLSNKIPEDKSEATENEMVLWLKGIKRQ